MIKRVDRYVGTAAILGIFGVWVMVNLLAFLFNLITELRGSTGGYGALDAFWYVFMTSPRAAYQVFPVCALIGALIGVGGLAAGNELVALRTSGISRLRIAGAALAGAMLFTVPVVAMGEWLAPVVEQQARVFRLGEKIGQYVIGGPRGMWLRDRDQIINIRQPMIVAGSGDQSVQFQNVVVYEFSGNDRLREVTRARRAAHDGTDWTLFDVSRLDFTGNAVSVTESDRAPWNSALKPELVDSAVTRPGYMSTSALWQQWRFLSQNGLDDRIYKSAFYARLLYPFTVLALVLAGMPFVFGPARQHNMGVRLFIGMTVGAVFTIVNGAVQNLGDAYGLSAAAAALVPSLLLGLGAILVLRKTV
ncbi:MAG: LPS export ABC transporter permease LptG [Xanthomonadales bacterium]|nr:LPS export ABC transporter permease LptG [Xanthomonadales bacterium]NIX12201.1 LPS export ABC transporter permease LptG [Xanthomonadales bacterium]